MTAARVNHVGICVSDLARARRFYEALGFVFERDLQPPDDLTGPLLGIPQPVGLTAAYLRCGDVVLELLHYRRGSKPSAAPRTMDELGLTHLSFTVADLPDVLERVRAAGGEVLDETDIGVAIMIRDPDGQLLELLPAKRDT